MQSDPAPMRVESSLWSRVTAVTDWFAWPLRTSHYVELVNIEGGKLFHVLSGNLSHQIEHHLFPDMCSNRYPEAAPRVRALAARYGLPYNSASLTRQFGSTWLKNLRLAFPGGDALDPAHGRA